MQGVAIAAVVVVFAGTCSFSIGGPDYAGLEEDINEQLTNAYAEAGLAADDVSCPRPDEDPAAGDTFICNASVAGSTVRVEVTVESDDGDVRFETLDLVYNLDIIAENIGAEVSQQSGTEVTVTCPGEDRVVVVPIGGNFECEVIDAQGDFRTITVTANGVGDTTFDIEPGDTGGQQADLSGLEQQIGEQLAAAYASVGLAPDSVSCPPPPGTPAPGDTFICNAAVAGSTVRVEVTVTSAEGDVAFNTLDLIYDLDQIETDIGAEVSQQVGGQVTVTCEGDPRIIVVPISGSFDCVGTDGSGEARTIRVTADGVDSTTWEVL